MKKLYFATILLLSCGLANAQTNYVATSPASGTPGQRNVIVGIAASNPSMTGTNNIIIGYQAGIVVNGGSSNIFIGSESGKANSNGFSNTFVGHQSGTANNNATGNTFIGATAGFTNNSGDANTFVGYEAGKVNSIGTDNAFMGYQAGVANTGSNNTFYGSAAGNSNSSGTYNTYLGYNSRGMATLQNTTAIGSNAYTRKNNTMILGDTTNNLQVGIGTSWPTQRLTIKGNFSFVAYNSGLFYQNNRFLFQDEQNNIALGTNHEADLQGNNNLLLGVGAKTLNTLNNATAIGSGSEVAVNNGFVLGNAQTLVGIGISAPTARLEVASGNDGESGIKLTNLNANNASALASSKFLTLDAQGNMKLASELSYSVKSTSDWADYVFEPSYKLPALSQVEQFLKLNKHLPNVPSATEMTTQNVSVAQMDAILLKKIEELTLYVIALEKENQTLKAQNKENKELQNRIEKLETLMQQLLKK
jgi:trimeric autotransporter adhesin